MKLNKRSFKNLGLVLLLSILFFNSPTFANAQHTSSTDSTSSLSFTTKDGLPALYDKKNNNYIIESYTSTGEKISLDQYKKLVDRSELPDPQEKNINLLQNSNLKKNDTIQRAKRASLINRNWFEVDLKWRQSEGPQRVSPIVDCPSSQPTYCHVSVTNSIQTTESFSTNVNISEMPFIRGSLGVGYSWSTATQSQIGINYNIPKGKRGYITFNPLRNHVRGYMHYAYSDITGYHEIGVSEMMYASCPVKSPQGFTDGIWSVVVE
ncbi:hypothetical protein ABNC92_18810 [Paenibacillus larvae]